ncbi:MAG: 1,4-dihydroxy-6-naphthoate synthase, partial [Chitinophagaceae bacterium]
MKLKIGISPCPNDTFIFDALLHHKIDTKGLEFEYYLEDIDTLNQWATEGDFDIIKISYAHYFDIHKKYNLLKSGGALGIGLGPLLVSKSQIKKINSDLKVGIPGKNTTANFLLQYVYPEFTKKEIFLFSEIEKMVLEEKVEIGVIIHENRFTYQKKGLYLVADLGKLWEIKTQLPIPLGGIVIKKNIDEKIQQQINFFIQQSIQFAWKNYPVLSDFVKDNAQSMLAEVMYNHIKLYVNNYSLDIGEKGKQAI